VVLSVVEFGSSGLESWSSSEGFNIYLLPASTDRKTVGVKDMCFTDDSTLYCTTHSDGLYSFNIKRKAWTTIDLGKLGITTNNLTKIIYSSLGTLWIGSDRGLFFCTVDKRHHFNTENGLISSEIYDVLEDENNNIWVLGNRGLSRIDTQNFILNYPIEKPGRSITNLTENSWLVNSKNGFLKINPNSRNERKPILLIEEIRINNDLVNRPNEIGELNLNHNQNNYSKDYNR